MKSSHLRRVEALLSCVAGAFAAAAVLLVAIWSGSGDYGYMLVALPPTALALAFWALSCSARAKRNEQDALDAAFEELDKR